MAKRKRVPVRVTGRSLLRLSLAAAITHGGHVAQFVREAAVHDANKEVFA